ncbi:hypothetical protein CAEBREN_11809 [Caenorhabditis brenneri]|uniref:Uncharacterized protein n=1 Tax=Caenorhabditis brenneri TaxID=135651 RepID=G0MG26_CAEBE|nr:hypothetical protein CAEBREN_11809 [Caenorhabditis brenneri]
MVVIECLQIGYQLLILRYVLFCELSGTQKPIILLPDISIESIRYILLFYIQLSLFFISSIAMVLYFVSFNGSQFLSMLLTLLNYSKLTFDTCCYGIIINSSRQFTLSVLDVAHVNFITHICRFFFISLYMYHGTRLDVNNTKDYYDTLSESESEKEIGYFKRAEVDDEDSSKANE